MPFDFDAPVIEPTDFTDISDVYVYTGDADGGGDYRTDATLEDEFLSVIVAGGDRTAGTAPFMSDDEDVFVFAAVSAGNSNAAPDNGTPAPPDEETPQERAVRELAEQERDFVNHPARHTATGAMLQRMLICG